MNRRYKHVLSIATLPFMSAAMNAQDLNGWYPFTPENDTGPSVLGMEDWSSEPAGARGRIARKGEKLVYDGKEIKLWGSNITFNRCAPEKPVADRSARFLRKYGINTMRLHFYSYDYGWGGIMSEHSYAESDPVKLDRMDYYVSRLKQNGVYVKLSHSGRVVLGAEDFKRIPYVDELYKRKNGRTIDGPALWFSKELQDTPFPQPLVR
jgi:hypothetical protein